MNSKTPLLRTMFGPGMLGLLFFTLPPLAAPSALLAQIPEAEISVRPDSITQKWWQLDPEADRIPGISLERAYNELLQGKSPKQSIVVAVIDNGVDIDHPDLTANIWSNQDELAGNNHDDDGNGYVDDVHGWNFIGGSEGSVGPDSYEVTRIYRELRPVCESEAGRAETRCWEEFPRVRDEYLRERAMAEAAASRTQTLYEGLRRVEEILKKEIEYQEGAFPVELTREMVLGLDSASPEVQRARTAWLQIDANGVSLAELEAETRTVANRVKYGYGLEENVRHIVGDDYRNLDERYYGNADVEGPDHAHGTHVAGIIGAVRNNGIGINGIAEAVRLMSVRAVPDGDERDKDVANAIRYAVDNGAKIINLSFGKGFSPEKGAVDEAVQYAESRGVLIVHAAGNAGEDLDEVDNFPNRTYTSGGAASNWIEVGASSWGSGADAVPAFFSNFGVSRVDIFAPGDNIYSTVPGTEMYTYFSGSSMASPVVAGVAALVWSHYPELSVAELKEVIVESALTSPALKSLSTSGGVVNAYRALLLAEEIAKEN